MSFAEQSSTANYLLQALSPEDFSLLQPHLEPVRLKVRQSLSEPNQPTRFVYFLESGLASIILAPASAKGVGIGIVGRDGLIGTSVVLGADQSPYEAFMQLEGMGWRIPSRQLTSLKDARGSLRSMLLLYVHVYLVQLSSTAHASTYFTVEERLARWILMCHDRIEGDQIRITHDSLSLVLGVRRPGITVATHMLEGEGMISATRGLITVIDRDKLRRKASTSYGLAECEYERVIGSTIGPD